MTYSFDIMKSVSTDRWLMEVGIVPETVEQNLMGFGYLASNTVTDVELEINVKKKHVKFILSLSVSDYRRYEISRRLQEPGDGLLRKGLKLLALKVSEDMRFHDRIGKMMKDYLPDYDWEIELKPK